MMGKHKKAVASQMFTYLFALLVIGFVVFLGAKLVVKMTSSLDKSSVEKFAGYFEEKAQALSVKPNSFQTFRVSAPRGIVMFCVYNPKKLNELVNSNAINDEEFIGNAKEMAAVFSLYFKQGKNFFVLDKNNDPVIPPRLIKQLAPAEFVDDGSAKSVKVRYGACYSEFNSKRFRMQGHRGLALLYTLEE